LKKTPAKKRAAPEAAPPPPIPLAIGPVPPEVRARLLLLAIESMRSGRQRGNSSSAWKVDASVLFGIAMAHLVEDRRLPGVAEAYRADLAEAGVSDKVLERFMQQLRRLYWRQVVEHVRSTAQAVDMSSMAKDPSALARHLLVRVSAFVDAHMDPAVTKSLTVGERNLVLRGFEACTKALDLMATAAFRQVQTERVRDAAERAKKAAQSELSRMKGVEDKQAVADLIAKALMGVQEAAS
jgi:hypothetical protein